MPQISLEDVAAPISRSNRTLALLCYGSWATNTQDEISDCDLIRVIPSGPLATKSELIQGVEVELSIGPEIEIRSRLHAKYRHNNNFWLNALSNSKLIAERDGSGSRLIEEARAVHVQGPPPLSPRERRSLRTGIHFMLGATLRAHRRRSQTPATQTLAIIRCGNLFMEATEVYYELKGHWGNSFKQLISDARHREPALALLWDRYVAADDANDKIMVVKELVESILEMEPI